MENLIQIDLLSSLSFLCGECSNKLIFKISISRELKFSRGIFFVFFSFCFIRLRRHFCNHSEIIRKTILPFKNTLAGQIVYLVGCGLQTDQKLISILSLEAPFAKQAVNYH